MGEVVFTRAGLRRGARECLPMMVASIPFGVVTGISAHGAGLSFAETMFMSITVFAGSAQLLALSAWTHPPSVLAASLAAFVVNLRLALMGPVLAPWLDRLRGWRVWLPLFVMTDQNWALSVRNMNAGGKDAAFLLGSGLTLVCMWISASALGHVVGTMLQPPPGHPVFFAALAVFVALLVGMWRGKRDLLPWAIAAVVAAIAARMFPGGSWHIILGALAGSLVGGLREHRANAPA